MWLIFIIYLHPARIPSPKRKVHQANDRTVMNAYCLQDHNRKRMCSRTN